MSGFSPTRFLSPLKVVIVLLVLSRSFSVLAQSNLTVVIPGIRDEASASWVGDATVVGSARQRYVIYYDDDTKRPGKFGEYLKRVGQLEYLKRLGPLFESENMIRVNPNDPKSQEVLRQKLVEIAKVPNATVVVDMSLKGWSLVDASVRSDSEWKKQTAWAGKIAADLAEQHLAKYPHQNYFGCPQRRNRCSDCGVST